MGLIIIGTPDDRLRSAGEHTVIKVMSTNYVATQGSKARLEITVSVIAVNGDEIIIHFADYVLTFYARTVFLNDGYDWPVSGPTLAEYCSKIVSALKINSLILANYNVSVSNLTIIIEAKEKGTERNFTVDAGYYSGMTGISSYLKTDAIDQEYYDFHSAELLLFGGNANETFANIQLKLPFYEGSSPMDGTGRSEFDIRKFADSFLSKHIQYPEFHNILLRPNHLAKIIASVSEVRGIPAVPVSKAFMFYYCFVHGGLSFEAENYYNTMPAEPFPVYDSGAALQELPFLTLQPDNKKVFFEQVEKLFYFCYHAYSNIYLKVKITKKDGTILTAYTSASYPSVAAFSMFEIVVSPYRLNLSNYVNIDDIAFYQVWLQDQGGGHLSNTRTYYLERKYYPKKRQFVFLTSRGGFDTVVCTGEQEFTQDVEREFYEVMSNDEHSSNDAETESLINLEEQKYKISTGWVKDDTNAWLRDFALSRIIFEIDSDGQFYRVYMTSKSIHKRTDNDFLYKMDFEYSRAYKDEFWFGYEFEPLYHANLVEEYPVQVRYPNLQDVVGRIFTDSDDYRDKTFMGEPMEVGQRFLIVNQTTLIGSIKVYDTASGGSFSDSWSVSFNIGGNDYTISMESYPGNRVYCEYDDAIYQVDENGAWMITTIISSAVNTDGAVTVKGKTFDNVDVDVYGAMARDGEYSFIGTIDPKDWRSTGLIFNNVVGYTYVKAKTRHCLYVYEDTDQILIT